MHCLHWSTHIQSHAQTETFKSTENSSQCCSFYAFSVFLFIWQFHNEKRHCDQINKVRSHSPCLVLSETYLEPQQQQNSPTDTHGADTQETHLKETYTWGNCRPAARYSWTSGYFVQRVKGWHKTSMKKVMRAYLRESNQKRIKHSWTGSTHSTTT